MQLDASHFPIYVFVKQPGESAHCEEPSETCFFIMKSYFNIDYVHRFGDYHFAFKKISIIRLPAPYSQPSCVVQGSSEAVAHNMFCGDYTLGKCLDTCWYKQFLRVCGSIPIAYRHIMSDTDFFKTHYKVRSFWILDLYFPTSKKGQDENIQRDPFVNCWGSHSVSVFCFDRQVFHSSLRPLVFDSSMSSMIYV